ncbi:lactonase family protein [Pontiella sp.]|uniref:lactonase family protein n=1 Tax=Pontiella sp. TaxID=2837462 RepID=UPI00356300D1
MHRILFSALAAALITGCTAPRTERVYIGTKKSSGIYFADLHTGTGNLSRPQRAVEAESVGFIAIAPDNTHLYSTGVSAFRIHPDGTLEKTGEQKIPEVNSCHVSTDHTGAMLMTAYYGSGAVASFGINDDGTLTLGSIHKHEGTGEDPKRQTMPHGHSIYPNPDNTYAYAADLGIDKIMIYQMDLENGKLIPAGAADVPGGSMGPRHMKWNGDRLYLLNELDLSISVFQALENGQLQFINTVSMLPEDADKTGLTGAEIRMHPNRKFLYTSIRDSSDRHRDSIITFRITPEGLERQNTTLAQVWYPRNFNIDPTGKWLLVGGQRSCDIAVFSIDTQTGHLSFTGQKMDFPGEPVCFEFLNG